MNDRGSETKTSFLYKCIKNDIASGVLAPGERLPSKRDLAEHLDISVMTVENTYICLEEEGYIYARPRSGYYVSELEISQTKLRSNAGVPHIIEHLPEELRSGGSDTGDIHVKGMARIMRRILSDNPDIMLQASPAYGCAVLRNAIADYLFRFRGMQVQPANILIGSGSEYLYGIIVQLLGRDTVIGIEYPSYNKIEKVYRASGVMIEHLPMTIDGISSEALAGTKANVLHVTPFHSYPTGVTASAGKRYEYLSWADKNDRIIVEDDFDSELSFFMKPIDTLYQMDSSGRVIYMNTFSKSMASGIRIAYMILPGHLLERYEQNLSFYSCTVPVFDQYVLAEYIADGSFERHLNRKRRAGRIQNL